MDKYSINNGLLSYSCIILWPFTQAWPRYFSCSITSSPSHRLALNRLSLVFRSFFDSIYGSSIMSCFSLSLQLSDSADVSINLCLFNCTLQLLILMHDELCSSYLFPFPPCPAIHNELDSYTWIPLLYLQCACAAIVYVVSNCLC